MYQQRFGDRSFVVLVLVRGMVYHCSCDRT